MATLDRDYDQDDDPAEQGRHGDRDVPKEDKDHEPQGRLHPYVRYQEGRQKPPIRH